MVRIRCSSCLLLHIVCSKRAWLQINKTQLACDSFSAWSELTVDHRGPSRGHPSHKRQQEPDRAANQFSSKLLWMHLPVNALISRPLLMAHDNWLDSNGPRCLLLPRARGGGGGGGCVVGVYIYLVKDNVNMVCSMRATYLYMSSMLALQRSYAQLRVSSESAGPVQKWSEACRPLRS